MRRKLCGLLALALFALPFGAGCTGVPVNHTPDPTANFARVSDGIYRGARPDHAALARLAAMGVHTVLDLEDDRHAIERERRWAAELGLVHVVASLSGRRRSKPDERTVHEALSILADRSRRPVFVHCKKGQDRTGAIVALHRVFAEGWSAEDARSEMMAMGFDRGLVTLERYVEDKIESARPTP